MKWWVERLCQETGVLVSGHHHGDSGLHVQRRDDRLLGCPVQWCDGQLMITFSTLCVEACKYYKSYGNKSSHGCKDYKNKGDQRIRQASMAHHHHHLSLSLSPPLVLHHGIFYKQSNLHGCTTIVFLTLCNTLVLMLLHLKLVRSSWFSDKNMIVKSISCEG